MRDSKTAHAFVFRFILAVSFFLASRFARADGIDGQWKQSPLRENYTVQTWLPGCGAAPTSSSTGGGESVSIHQEGDELSFVGGGRTYNSRDCYDPFPTLARESHSHDPAARTWRTRCTTPANDPRHAAMNTLVQVTSDTHIVMSETGRYEITLSDGRCVVDISRTRSFDLVKSDTAVPAVTSAPAPAPTPVPVVTPPSSQCASPGEPARLEVRPSRKILRQGETFSFHALVLDSAGCATNTATSWAISDQAKGVTVDTNGKVIVLADAPEGEVDLTVSAAGKTAHVTLAVSSASHYDALLSQSGLNAAGESDVASTVSIASASIGGSAGHGDDGAKKRKTIFIIIVASAATLLGIVALVGFRRSKRAALLAREAEERHEERVREIEERQKQRAEEHATQLAAHEESKKKAEEHVRKQASLAPSVRGMVCPSCRREFPKESTFCPHDGNQLVPVTAAAPLSPPAPHGNVCPTCRRGYDPGIKLCPADGDELVAHAMLATAAPGLPKAKGKICPTCGSRFGPEGTFCGKDGTALVLLI